MKAGISRLFHSRSFGIFLFFWLLFGTTTCLDNLHDYNLQQMGVDAIVSHHTFSLGHAHNDRLMPLGDTFHVGENTLAAKQPGQFVWGAIPYFFLHLAGVDYETNYDLASALVTWSSAGFMTALALVFLDRLLWQIWGFSCIASLAATLLLGMASTWLPYAGIAHHDMEAASLIVLALYAMERNRLAEGKNMRLVFLGGVLLGLTVFTSMLPALIVLVLGLSGLFTRSLQRILWHAGGCLAGVLPLFIYNGWYFGSAFVPANVAGNYNDTFFSPKMVQFLDHMKEYLGTGGLSIWKYAPGLTLGFIGIFLLPPTIKRMRWILAAAIFVHFTYVTNIETLGTCEYGPRYLLPVMALLAPGAAALIDWRGTQKFFPGKIFIAGALVTYGFLVNVVGALRGTMYCDLGQFALWDRFQGINHLQDNNSPLLGAWLALPLLLFLIWIFVQFNDLLSPPASASMMEASVAVVAPQITSTTAVKKKSKQKLIPATAQDQGSSTGNGKKK